MSDLVERLEDVQIDTIVLDVSDRNGDVYLRITDIPMRATIAVRVNRDELMQALVGEQDER